jgi:hypothetical protein
VTRRRRPSIAGELVAGLGKQKPEIEGAFGSDRIEDPQGLGRANHVVGVALMKSDKVCPNDELVLASPTRQPSSGERLDELDELPLPRRCGVQVVAVCSVFEPA